MVTYQQIQDAAKKKGLGQSVVDQFAAKQGVAVPPVIAKASNVDKSAIVNNAGTTINPNTGANYQAGYAIRKPPTGATPQNPVVDRATSPGSTVVPDYSMLEGLDQRGLQRYIDSVGYDQAAGKATRDDILRSKEALYRLQDLAKSSDTNTAAYDKLIKEQEDAKAAKAAELSGQSDSAVNQYDTYLKSNLANSVAQANKAAERESQAQQSASSFSGFGRSTFNQDQIGQIQERATQTINSLQQAKDLELQRYKAEQAGADSKTLEGYDTQINSYKLAAANAEQAAITHANEINTKANEDYATKVQNLLASVTQTAKDFASLTDQDKQTIQSYAGLLLDDKGNVDKEVLAKLPAGLSAYVINEAAKLKGTQGSKDTVTTGSGKTSKTYQYNPKTGKYDIPVGNSGSGGGGKGSGNGNPLPPPTGTNLKQLGDYFDLSQTAQYKAKIPATSADNLVAGRGTAISTLNAVQQVLNDNKAASGIEGTILSLSTWATNTKLANQQLSTAAQVVGKFLEGGKLAEGDISRYRDMLPSVGDNRKVAQGKLDNVKKLIIDNYNSTLDNYARGQYDMSNFDYIPSVGAVFKGEAKTADTTKPTAYDAKKTYKTGDTVIKDGKNYVKHDDGKFYLAK